MMGFYLFQGNKLNRDASTVVVDGKTWTETDFVPMHHVQSPLLSLPPVFNESYVIMPTTWDPNKSGRFLLSVSADCEFTLWFSARHQMATHVCRNLCVPARDNISRVRAHGYRCEGARVLPPRTASVTDLRCIYALFS